MMTATMNGECFCSAEHPEMHTMKSERRVKRSAKRAMAAMSGPCRCTVEHMSGKRRRQRRQERRAAREARRNGTAQTSAQSTQKPSGGGFSPSVVREWGETTGDVLANVTGGKLGTYSGDYSTGGTSQQYESAPRSGGSILPWVIGAGAALFALNS